MGGITMALVAFVGLPDGWAEQLVLPVGWAVFLWVKLWEGKGPG